MEHFDLARMLKFLPGIVLGLTVHEFSHAYMARHCGDNTSEAQGRVTLNPFKHIDLLGFLMLLVAGFGWAKPVEFNEANLRNPRKDVMKIAAAGPVSNALFAMVLSVLYVIYGNTTEGNYNNSVQVIREIFLYGIYINWGLFIFNLIPLPPLDGSHLLLNQFKKFPNVYDAMYKYGSYIFLGLILVTVFTDLNLFPIGPAMEFLARGFLSIIGAG